MFPNLSWDDTQVSNSHDTIFMIPFSNTYTYRSLNLHQCPNEPGQLEGTRHGWKVLGYEIYLVMDSKQWQIQHRMRGACFFLPLLIIPSSSFRSIFLVPVVLPSFSTKNGRGAQGGSIVRKMVGLEPRPPYSWIRP